MVKKSLKVTNWEIVEPNLGPGWSSKSSHFQSLALRSAGVSKLSVASLCTFPKIMDF